MLPPNRASVRLCAKHVKRPLACTMSAVKFYFRLAHASGRWQHYASKRMLERYPCARSVH